MQVDKTTPFWDAALSEQARIDWLLEQMTLDEKLRMIAGGGGAGVERLGIPGVGVGGEAAHGVQARNDWGPAHQRIPPDITTSFVQPIGMSATWDAPLLREAGEVTGEEARALAAMRGGRGLCRWAPTVDIERDPRWGRTEEGYGEDPFLIGEMAGAYVRGLRGDDPYYIRVAATLKHFYANNTERGRTWKNASIDPRNKYELYLEPFRRVIERGGAQAVMTAYNRINGAPGIVNPDVGRILKREYGLVHAVGDGGAMELVVKHARHFGLHAQTVAAALKAGVDSMSDDIALVYPAAKEAYALGLIDEDDLDRAIANVMRTQLRLGIYDARRACPYVRAPGEGLCSQAHAEVCHRVSCEAVVLLENDGMLPLRGAIAGDIALIGPLADAWYQDWYGGEPPCRTTLADGMRALLGDVACFDGHDRVTFHAPDGRALIAGEDGALRLGERADAFILEDWGEGKIALRCARTGLYWAIDPGAFAGGRSPVAAKNRAAFTWFNEELFHISDAGDGAVTLTSRFDAPVALDAQGMLVTGEGLTPARLTMRVALSGTQAAAALAREKKTVVLALGLHPMLCAKEELDRQSIALPPRQQALMDAVTDANPNAALVLLCNAPLAFRTRARAALWSATGAQDMGLAVAKTLLGHSAPAGRLNMTWYKADGQLPDIDDYDIIRGGRTYRYFTGEPLYPFGHGLTYTDFVYGDMHAALEGEAIAVRFTVANAGGETSDEVAQVYAVAPPSRARKPLRQLVGFARLRAVAPGEVRAVRIDVPLSELRFYDVVSARLMVEAGRYTLLAGRSSAALPLRAQVDVPGETTGLRDLRVRVGADHYDECEGVALTLGAFGYPAATPLCPSRAATLTYRDVDASTLGGGLVLYAMSAGGGSIEALLDGRPAGAWRGDTADGDGQRPFAMMDDATREDEPLRIALQTPGFAQIALSLDARGLRGACALTLRLTGDVRLCWLQSME